MRAIGTLTTRRPRPADAWAAGAVAAAVTIAFTDSWRTAATAGLAAAAILATRVRYALPVAAVLLLATATLALGGNAAAHSQRPAVAIETIADHQHHSHRGAAHAKHQRLRRRHPRRGRAPSR